MHVSPSPISSFTHWLVTYTDLLVYIWPVVKLQINIWYLELSSIKGRVWGAISCESQQVGEKRPAAHQQRPKTDAEEEDRDRKTGEKKTVAGNIF